MAIAISRRTVSWSGRTLGIPKAISREGIQRKRQFDAPSNPACMKSAESLQGTGRDTVQTMCLVIHAFVRGVNYGAGIVWLNRVWYSFFLPFPPFPPNFGSERKALHSSDTLDNVLMRKSFANRLRYTRDLVSLKRGSHASRNWVTYSQSRNLLHDHNHEPA